MKKSFYIDINESENFTRSASSIEVDKVDQLVENLLKEFDHSSDEEKNKYRPILKKWLSNMDEAVLHQADEQKTRDFIYEMF